MTGDRQYSEQVASALGATRKLLSLRPAEWLYRSLYWAVGLTLLPVKEAEQLPVASTGAEARDARPFDSAVAPGQAKIPPHGDAGRAD